LDNRQSLPKNTVLGESYRIERAIGSGGFGITYAAEDIHLGTRVAIKEYYPDEFGSRDDTMRVRPKSGRQKETFDWGLRSFLQEARTLARFRHPSVVQVTRVFEAFSTAYMVMTFEEGKDVEAWLRSLGRAPTQGELDRIAGPLLDALEMMHAQNFLHRDIAPDNIIVRADGTPVLLDFGAARRAVAEKSRTLTGIVKTGYSPFEQYATDGRLQGPWTDLYAFGATLYRAVTGKPPEEATLRIADDRMIPAITAATATYRTGFLTAIDACLRAKHAERPQSVAALRPMLLGQDSAEATRRLVETRKVDSMQPPPTAATLSPAGGRWLLAVAAMLLAVAGGAYGGFHFVQWHPKETRTAEAKPATTSLAEPAAAESSNAGQVQSRESAATPKENPYAGKRVSADSPRKAAKFDEREGRELFTTIGGARPDLDAASLDDCRLSCSADSTCKGFEFQRADHSCRLFSKIVKSAPSKTAYSGIR
jgi:serine/threonine protein kinase